MNKHTLFGATALQIAIGGGRIDIVKLLLCCDRFDAVNDAGQLDATALHDAAFHGHVEIAKLLLESERFTAVNAIANNGIPGRCTALHTAAYQGHFEIANLIATNSRFTAQNAKDIDGKTWHDIARATRKRIATK